ncbi:MAG: M23 family metallopeptidase [Candidatus Peregrinibacteria bacterium]
MSSIENANVNTQARLARHAKLKLHSPSPVAKNGIVSRSIHGIQHSLGLDAATGMLSRVTLNAVLITIAFLLITPFAPFYQETEGSYGEGGNIDLLNLTEQDPESALANVITEDGFLLKPSLETTAGDRSGFSDVFAYTVEPGDTLSSVAERFGLNKETVMWENNLWNSNQIRTGMTLKILPVNGVSHMVKKGETVASIAKKYKIETEAIVKQNQLEDPTLVADMLLIVPGAKKAIPVPTFAAAAPSLPPPSQLIAIVGKLLYPVGRDARLTQGFGRRHYGLDLASHSAGPIYAAAAGKVITVKNGYNGGYGNFIVIDHGNGMQTLYGHNAKLYVSEGQYVEQGQTISWMGSTGRSTGTHLHFEVRVNGVKYNPANFF